MYLITWLLLKEMDSNHMAFAERDESISFSKSHVIKYIRIHLFQQKEKKSQ